MRVWMTVTTGSGVGVDWEVVVVDVDRVVVDVY